MSNTSRAFRNGWFTDIEDSRTTSRRRAALQALRAAGVDYKWTCSEAHVERRSAPYEYSGHDDKCGPTWPEWVTDEMFDQAYALADKIVTARGQWNRAAAYVAKLEGAL